MTQDLLENAEPIEEDDDMVTSAGTRINATPADLDSETAKERKGIPPIYI